MSFLFSFVKKLAACSFYFLDHSGQGETRLYENHREVYMDCVFVLCSSIAVGCDLPRSQIQAGATRSSSKQHFCSNLFSSVLRDAQTEL